MAKKQPARPKRATKSQTFAERVFLQHLDELSRLINRRGIKGLDRLYLQARSDLTSEIRKFRPGDNRVEPATLRAMLAQVEAVLARTGRGLEANLKDVGKTASEMGASHGIREFKLFTTRFEGTTPVLRIEAPALFSGLIEDVDSSLLTRYQLQSRTWTPSAIANVERVLTSSSMIGQGTERVVTDVQAALDTERWKAERIVRTETAYAHGTAKLAAMTETAKELKIKLYKRLIENVSNGRGLDDRIGDDSLLIHGQTVPLDKPFTFKKRVRGAWQTVAFMHPPNRPNDRAVVIPWDPEWDAEEQNEVERPLTISELKSAPPTRWRKTTGVKVPPGHKPGKSYGKR